MRITKTACFDRFSCIAGACPDSCCKEWDVQVDEASAALYRALPGDLGDRLRQVLRTEDGETVMSIIDGRCPMWRQDGLCRIQAELGEEALCHTCREFPRLTHDYGDFVEKGLELSCPEAARLILLTESAPMVTEEVPGGEEPEYDKDAMEDLKQTREGAFRLLGEDRPVGQTLALLLLWGYEAQNRLDGGEPLPFEPEEMLRMAQEHRRPGDLRSLLDFFAGLEILNPLWKDRLAQAKLTGLHPLSRKLARYFVERYWLQAVSDYDLVCRVKFMVIACLAVSALGADFLTDAQSFSKEIENNYDNVEAVLDGAYTHPAFTDDKLLGLLLG